jgi:uncharacterized repeat protein (TIGR03803 family)
MIKLQGFRSGDSMLTPLRRLTAILIAALPLMAARPAQAQTESILHTFNGFNGGGPTEGLTPDGEGNFYGVTVWGGSFAAGNVYKLSQSGSGVWNETVLYIFTGGADGCNPDSKLVFDAEGNLYGTANSGGAYGRGVVFELSPEATAATGWKEKVLHSFVGGSDGSNPYGNLIFDGAGNLYGTVDDWLHPRFQAVFELSPSAGEWTERVIYYTKLNGAGLTMDRAGNIYGAGLKEVFKLSRDDDDHWDATVIHTFKGAGDGNQPCGTPIFDKAGNLYGTTYAGGVNNLGTVYKLTRAGHGEWKERILYSFQGGSDDGSNPVAGIVFDGSGNIYGSTTTGGSIWGGGQGTIFELAPSDRGQYEERVLWSFDGTDGSSPDGVVILDNAGNIYGTAIGGSLGAGVVFQITP